MEKKLLKKILEKTKFFVDKKSELVLARFGYPNFSFSQLDILKMKQPNLF